MRKFTSSKLEVDWLLKIVMDRIMNLKNVWSTIWGRIPYSVYYFMPHLDFFEYFCAISLKV